MNKPDKMKAVVCHKPWDYRLEEVDYPAPGREEFTVKIKATGICASDIKAYHGAERYWGKEGVDPWLKAPVIAGHEFYGEVVEMGPGAAERFDIKPGDLITADQIVPCGQCEFCKRGQYWMCEVHNIYGFQKDVAEGSMAEYMKLGRNSVVHKVPDSLSMKEASLIEPMANGIHAVERADIGFDDVVVLAGAGSIGLGMVQLILMKTPKKLIVLDIDDKRLEIASNYGADVCINPKKENAVEKVKELTNGYGCDVYIESTGSPVGITQGLEMIRKLGRFVEFSVFAEKTPVDWSVIGVGKELDIRGAHLSPYTFPTAINLFERKLLKADDIVTHVYDLTDFEEALKIAEKPEAIKVVLVP